MEHCYLPLELLDLDFLIVNRIKLYPAKFYIFPSNCQFERIKYQFSMNNFKSLFIVARYTVSL